MPYNSGYNSRYVTACLSGAYLGTRNIMDNGILVTDAECQMTMARLPCTILQWVVEVSPGTVAEELDEHIGRYVSYYGNEQGLSQKTRPPAATWDTVLSWH